MQLGLVLSNLVEVNTMIKTKCSCICHQNKWSKCLTGLTLVGSILCGIHCCLFPVIMSILPTILPLDKPLLIFLFGFSATILLCGYKKHRVIWPFLLFLEGIGLFYTMRFMQLRSTHILYMVLFICTVNSSVFWNAYLLKTRNG